MKFFAKITFTVDANHPDIQYIKDWTEDKIFDFSDYYTFNNDWTEEEAILHMKLDLKLVAGGGYNTEHIHNVEFEIKRI